MHFSRSKLSLFLMLGILLGGIWSITETEAQRRRSSRSAREAQKRAKLAMTKRIGEIIAELEKGEATDLLQKSLDPESERASTIVKRITETPAERARLIRVLEKFEQASLVFSPEKEAATLFASINKEDAASLRPPANIVVETAGNVSGYGDHLAGAIQDSLKDLKNKKFQNFIRNMYPEAEVQRLAKSEQEKYLIARFNQHPVLVGGLLYDLQAALVLKAKPVKLENRTVVSFKIPEHPQLAKFISKEFSTAPESPTREIRFELVNGNWRFFDGSTTVRKEMKRQRLGLATDGGISVEWKRTKAGWRISSIPFF